MKCMIGACPRRMAHMHHLIPQQTLVREGHADKLRDARNLVPMCFDHHLAHENWSGHGRARLTRDLLPARVWEFARELGEWAVVRLEREYPVRDHDARPAAANGT